MLIFVGLVLNTYIQSNLNLKTSFHFLQSKKPIFLYYVKLYTMDIAPYKQQMQKAIEYLEKELK
ncbi:TPA: hypothetical protein DIC40_07110 [Patescibacteria group bacterium]|nr:hypothetical protein [Candidatus Gracilibacteria bacterium]